MFAGRIYRAAFAPLLIALVIAGFSLTRPPGPLTSTLAPDAFDGARAFATLRALAAQFPDRQPGSAGDDRLAEYLASTLRGLGGGAGGGFQVSTRTVDAHTIAGERTLRTVIALRPGSTGESPIVILAHRDAAVRGSIAELSGTAALLELAQVFSHTETRRAIVLVSTSGGSAGYAGARDFIAHAPRPLDAAIALGDMAATRSKPPLVLPFSAGAALAPQSLWRTLARTVSQETGLGPATPGAGAQLAHLAFPLASGEQAPLDAAGVPAVLLQVSGEPGPSPHAPVSEAQLQSFGRAVLSATYALDEGPDISTSINPRVELAHNTLPGWAVRLLTLALLIPPLLAGVDALARMRRHGEPVMRWVAWVLLCALPFLACAVFAILLGALGLIAAPAGAPSAVALSADGSARGAISACVLVLALAFAALPALARRLALPLSPDSDGAALAAMLVLLALAVLTWIFNPFACLLLLPATHLWMVAVSPSTRRRAPAIAAIALSLAPLGLLLVAYAHELGLGPVAMAESAVLLPAGGQVGLFAAILWSVAFGCLLATILLARPRTGPGETPPQDWAKVTTRGPLSYAGPGSLGGTESALRH